MKQTVKKNDYELYTFKIPLSMRGKKRRAFITKELEKNHPCFSQQCCFDSKVQLKGGKFQSIVAVMDKVKLLEYRGKSKSGVKLEGVKNADFFSENNSLLFLLIIGFAILMFLILGGISFLPKKKNMINDSPVVEQTAEIEKTELKINAYDILEKYFLRTATSSGIIKNFSYMTDNFSLDDSKMDLSFDTKKIYPENISLEKNELPESAVQNFSAISYENELPTFSVSFNSSNVEVNHGEQIDFEVMSILRNELGKKSLVLWEDLNDASFELTVKDNDFCELFSNLGNCLKNQNLEIKKLSLVPGENIHQISVGFCSTNEKDKNLSLLFADFWNLFCEKKNEKIEVQEKKVTQEKVQVKNEPKESVENKKINGEKVGGVLTKDGTKIVFYKYDDGKIRGVEE